MLTNSLFDIFLFIPSVGFFALFMFFKRISVCMIWYGSNLERGVTTEELRGLFFCLVVLFKNTFPQITFPT